MTNYVLIKPNGDRVADVYGRKSDANYAARIVREAIGVECTITETSLPETPERHKLVHRNFGH